MKNLYMTEVGPSKSKGTLKKNGTYMKKDILIYKKIANKIELQVEVVRGRDGLKYFIEQNFIEEKTNCPESYCQQETNL